MVETILVEEDRLINEHLETYYNYRNCVLFIDDLNDYLLEVLNIYVFKE